ncbi:hypothetical protein AOP6_0781 [Desulfuromonas sp. AOP6]|nr:hypothetical protein AOP6_0781 [Desulfuromonas sp. AOP6]
MFLLLLSKRSEIAGSGTQKDSFFQSGFEEKEGKVLTNRKARRSGLFWVNTRRFALTNKDQEGANPSLQDRTISIISDCQGGG